MTTPMASAVSTLIVSPLIAHSVNNALAVREYLLTFLYFEFNYLVYIFLQQGQLHATTFSVASQEHASAYWNTRNPPKPKLIVRQVQ